MNCLESIKILNKKQLFEENNIFWKYASIIAFFAVNMLYFLLAMGEVFWYDEAYTVGMIYRDFSDIINITSNDVHSPFYYLILKIFYHTVGMESLISIKIFSWVFMIAYLIFGMKICQKHYSKRVTFFWLILSGWMPSMIIQATSARMYTLGMFWVSVASYLAYSLYQNESQKKWIFFVITTIIAIYIHTFSMIEMVVIYAIFGVCAMVKKRYSTLCKIVGSGLIVSASYVPWLLVLIKQFRRWAGVESGWSNTIQPFGWPLIKSFCAEWFSSIENPHSKVVTFGICVFVFAGVLCIKYIKNSKDYLPCLGLCAAIIVLISASLISIYIVPCFLGRYLFPLFGGVWLFVAVGLNQIRASWKQWILVIGIVICGLFAFDEELKLENEQGLEYYREFLETDLQEDDIIMADTYISMMMSIYCPEATYMVYGHKPDCLPFDNCGVFKEWEQLDGKDTIWYISVDSFRAGNLNAKYDVVEKREIPFSYYNVILEKYMIKSDE